MTAAGLVNAIAGDGFLLAVLVRVFLIAYLAGRFGVRRVR